MNSIDDKVDIKEEFDTLMDFEAVKKWLQLGHMEKALKLLGMVKK